MLKLNRNSNNLVIWCVQPLSYLFLISALLKKLMFSEDKVFTQYRDLNSGKERADNFAKVL